MSISRAKIKGIRAALGLSQESLAQALRVGRSAVKDWESGKFAPRPGVVDDLYALLDQHDTDYEAIAQEPDPVRLRVPAGRPDGWGTGLALRLALDDRDFDWDTVNGVALDRAQAILPHASPEAVRALAQWATDHRGERIGVIVTTTGRRIVGTTLPEQGGPEHLISWVTDECDIPGASRARLADALPRLHRELGEHALHTTVWDLMP